MNRDTLCTFCTLWELSKCLKCTKCKKCILILTIENQLIEYDKYISTDTLSEVYKKSVEWYKCRFRLFQLRVFFRKKFSCAESCAEELAISTLQETAQEKGEEIWEGIKLAIKSDILIT